MSGPLRVAPSQTEEEADVAIGLAWLREIATDPYTHWQSRARALLAEIERLHALAADTSERE